jgi:hypothetical protein
MSHLQRKQGPFYIDDDRPFAQRHDGMSLDIIHPKDVPRGKVPFIKDEDKSLKTQDIDRAAPHYPHLHVLNKPDFSVGCTETDHVGGRARTYYPSMDRRPRDLSLTTADIELAQTKATNFKGNRHTDPLCPNYELSSTNARPISPPRWNGRHTNDISDIEKSHPKVRIPDRNYIRDPNCAADIEFASANYLERVHRQTRNNVRADRSLNVKDINHKKPLHTAPRCTNPLEPEYKVSTTATTSLHTKYTEELGSDVRLHPKECETHGHVHGSKPRKLQWDNGEPQFSLMREDIAGTVPQRWVGAVPFNIYDPPEVKPAISFHDPHDIPGAQVGTLKKGIEGSGRGGSTNPLNPRYKMLDGDVRPQPVPVFEAERNPAMLHSMMQSRAQASSLPNLHARVNSQVPTPMGSVPPSQRSLQRDMSEPTLRRSLRGSPAGSQRSGGGTPQHYRPPSGAGHSYAQAPPGSTIKIPIGKLPSSGQRTPVGNDYMPQNYSYSPQHGDYSYMQQPPPGYMQQAPPGDYGGMQQLPPEYAYMQQ